MNLTTAKVESGVQRYIDFDTSFSKSKLFPLKLYVVNYIFIKNLERFSSKE